MPAADLLAAVSAAIDVAPAPAPKNEPADPLEEVAEAPEGGEPEGEEPEGEEPEGEEEGEEESEEGEEEGEEPEVGADGKPVVAAKTPEQIAAETALANKPKDHVNDPIDPRLKEATRERITGLIEIAKDLTTRYEKVNADHAAIMEPILASRASIEQFDQAMQYVGAVNSGNPAIMEKAWTFMLGEMQALGRMLGKDVPGLDYLAAYPDLKQMVAEKQITEAAAREMAIHRDTAAHRTRQSQAQQEHQTTTDTRNRALQAGANALNELGAQLRASDPQYPVKAKILTDALKGTFKDIDPAKWAASYKRAYDALVLPKTPAAVVPKRKSALPANQPLRGKQPAGGTVAAPKSAREAIENALSGM